MTEVPLSQSFNKLFLLYGIALILILFPIFLWASEKKEGISTIAGKAEEGLKPKLILKDGLLSMNVKEADLRGILREIGRQAGIKVLVDRDLEKKVTVKFEHIPLREGLERILKGENYFLVFDEGKINPVRRSDGTLDPTLPNLFRESSSMTSRSRPSNGVKEVRVIGKGKERNLVLLYSPEAISMYEVQQSRQTPLGFLQGNAWDGSVYG